METGTTKKVSIVLRPHMEMKERIQVKAEELFRRFGIRSVTMDEISSQLGISKKTLYQTYSDKEEIVSAVFERMMGESKSRCVCQRDEAVNAVHEVFLAFDHVMEVFAEMNPSILFDLHKYHPNVYTKFNDFKYTFLYNVISENLRRGMKEELYRPDIDVDILTRYRIESTMLAFNTEIFPQSKKDLVGVEWILLEHFLLGISTSRGVKMINKYHQQRLKQK